jgi:hypothetical protein
MPRTIYRDSKSGQFVSKKKWKRSKRAGDSKRYKREIIREKKPPVAPPLPSKVYEFIVSYSYDASARSFDVIVTAMTAEEARKIARQFLARDPKGKNIAKARFIGWSERIARGKVSDELPGEAEYRDESTDL